jgi:predicted nucleic acid-binding protein
MSASAFLDTNVLLYLLSADVAKANRAETIVAEGGVISVQVLNEFTAVAIRKLKMDWTEVTEVLTAVQTTCPVEPLTVETHHLGCLLAQRYGFSVYDAMIVAAARLTGCRILYSEDMHNGLCVEERLVIRNPFL